MYYRSSVQIQESAEITEMTDSDGIKITETAYSSNSCITQPPQVKKFQSEMGFRLYILAHRNVAVHNTRGLFVRVFISLGFVLVDLVFVLVGHHFYL